MKVIINGAFGRMGRAVAECIKSRDGDVVVYGADIAAGTADFPVGATLSEFGGSADVVIDFSHHAQAAAVCEFALSAGLPAVIATTGHTEEEKALINKAAESIPIFMSANMSVGVALLCRLCEEAAAVLTDADIEITEKHHNKKLDAPSGTALMLADSIKAIRKDSRYVYDRSTVRAARSKEEIGIHSVRAGNIVGEHEVLFALGNEHITVSHSALSRELFADGAVKAAEFLIGKPAGIYGMKQLLSELV